MSRLTLDAHVAPQDLLRFAEAAKGKSIVAEKTDDGTIVLHSRRGPNFKLRDRISGRSGELARAAVFAHLEKFGARAELQNGFRSSRFQVALSHLGSGSVLKKETLLKAADQAAWAVKASGARGLDAEKALAIADPNQRALATFRVADGIGKMLARNILRQGPGGRASRFDAPTIRPGEPHPLKDEMLSRLAVSGKTSPFATTYARASEEIRVFIDAAVSAMLANLPDRCLGQDETGRPRYRFGDHEYKFERSLGRGTNGQANLYVSTSDPERKIVVKTAVYTIAEDEGFGWGQQNALRDELRGFARIGGAPNAIGFIGAARTPGGDIAIATEFAPHGDGRAVLDKLSDERVRLANTPELPQAAAFTLLRDMAKGLRGLHERGILHRDVKPDNYFIGADGKARIADFDEAEKSKRAHLRQEPTGTPAYQSPELLRKQEDYFADRGIQQVVARHTRAVDELREKFGESKAVQLRRPLDQGRDKALDAKDYRSTAAMDVWALGIAAYELLFGDVPFPNKQAQEAFGHGSNNRVINKPRHQLTDAEKLINAMLHPDPAKRPSIDEVLQSPIFASQGVGKPETYAYIKALASGSAEEIDQASRKLADGHFEQLWALPEGIIRIPPLPALSFSPSDSFDDMAGLSLPPPPPTPEELERMELEEAPKGSISEEPFRPTGSMEAAPRTSTEFEELESVSAFESAPTNLSAKTSQ